MLVQVGPFPSASALAFIEFARTLIAELVTRHGMDMPSIDSAMAERFESTLDEWEGIARSGPEFLWTADQDVEDLEYHFVAYVRLVIQGDPLGRTSERAPDAEARRPFRVALVNGVLSALEREGGASASLAAELRAEWPDEDVH